MFRIRFAIASSLALFLGAGWLMGQDTKPADTPAPAKVKGTLPAYFSKLGLTDEQRQKVYKIHASYKSKIDALKEQMAQLTNEERVELNKVLSDTQRQRLRELRSRDPEATKESTPAAEKKEASKDAEKKEASKEGKDNK
jgi:Spy/CpxP family protein refolding chaperone